MFVPSSGRPIDLRTLKLVHFAMIGGVVMFAIIVLALVGSGSVAPQLGEESPTISNVLLLALAVFTVAAIVASFVVRIAVLASFRRQHPERPPEDEIEQVTLQAYATVSIVSAAIAEGASLFGLVVLLLTGNYVALIVPALGVLAILARFPSESKRAAVEPDLWPMMR